jgi:hypothetical protein
MSKQERISIEQLKKGDIVTFYYSSGTDPRPVILYLNTYNNFIHGINLNYLSQSQMEYLKAILNKKTNVHYDVEDPKLFYDNEIKNTPVKLAYRHYMPSKMIQIFKLGFKTETLEADLGLKKEKGTTQPEQGEKIITPINTDSGITKPDIPSALPQDLFGVDYSINKGQ